MEVCSKDHSILLGDPYEDWDHLYSLSDCSYEIFNKTSGSSCYRIEGEECKSCIFRDWNDENDEHVYKYSNCTVEAYVIAELNIYFIHTVTDFKGFITTISGGSDENGKEIEYVSVFDNCTDITNPAVTGEEIAGEATYEEIECPVTENEPGLWTKGFLECGDWKAPTALYQSKKMVVGNKSYWKKIIKL